MKRILEWVVGAKENASKLNVCRALITIINAVSVALHCLMASQTSLVDY